jgi:hypothetical protein
LFPHRRSPSATSIGIAPNGAGQNSLGQSAAAIAAKRRPRYLVPHDGPSPARARQRSYDVVMGNSERLLRPDRASRLVHREPGAARLSPLCPGLFCCAPAGQTSGRGRNRIGFRSYWPIVESVEHARPRVTTCRAFPFVSLCLRGAKSSSRQNGANRVGRPRNSVWHNSACNASNFEVSLRA